MYSNLVIVILSLFTTVRSQHVVRRDLSFFASLFGPPMACRATLKTEYQGITLQKCTPFADMGGVTEAGDVKNIDLNLLIRRGGRPGIEISFKAISSTSQQKYKINVIHSIDGKIYCGIITTAKPSKKILQQISLIMTCNFNTLAPSIDINVTVSSTIHGVQKGCRNENFKIPYCHDAIMIRSTECAEYRRTYMKLALMQVNSGIKVLFDMDLAYRGNRNTNISLQLRSQRPGKGINGFVDVGEVVTLGYPQDKHIFKDLVLGENYRVLIWRSTDRTIYYRDITLENSNRRSKRYIYWLSRTLQR